MKEIAEFKLDDKEFNKILAKKFLEKIEETRPNKEKTAYEQANEEQKKCIDYFKKVAKTGEV